jgi:hypothetical protein
VYTGEIATSGFRATASYPMTRNMFEDFHFDAGEKEAVRGENSLSEGTLSPTENAAHTSSNCCCSSEITANSVHNSLELRSFHFTIHGRNCTWFNTARRSIARTDFEKTTPPYVFMA